eukprot:CAMPEP_0196815914 /NCGR_PEP_ID=MMETSP1362-20130617/52595_1 /TAXON_ID=163516 /ORGANISM="Leptocylindrus danicus, Strain CCMP1856" /LENGTH=444 /DNA_ID=CAMNT_0042193057 /DNA_START=31 /DNA_END=1365 /DNA_ORIENTATION=+
MNQIEINNNNNHNSNVRDSDPFFDPKWDSLWQLAELELMEVNASKQQTPEFSTQRKKYHRAKHIVPPEEPTSSTLPTPVTSSATDNSRTTSEWMQVFETTPLFVPEYERYYTSSTRMHMRPLPLSAPRRVSSYGEYSHINAYSNFEFNYNYTYRKREQKQQPPIPSVICVPSESSSSSQAVQNAPMKEQAVRIPLKRRLSNKSKVVKHRYVDYSLVSDDEALNHQDRPICGTPIEVLLKHGGDGDSSSLSSLSSASASDKNQEQSNGIKSPSPCGGDKKKKKKKSRPQDTFPKKLHTVLSKKEYEHIITWLPHGRSFIVRDPEALTRHVFPGFFKLKKYNSFIRQLSLWGFKRMTRGIDAKSYYNPLFLRGKPALVSRMTLTLIKGTGTKLKSNPDEEPDLHSLSVIRPLPEVSAAEVVQQARPSSSEELTPPAVRKVSLVRSV